MSKIIQGPAGLRIDCRCEDEGPIIVEWYGESASIEAALDGWIGDSELPQHLVDWIDSKYDDAYDIAGIKD